MKADLMLILDSFGIPRANLRLDENVPEWFHPGRSAGLALGAKNLGFFGELHPMVCERFGIKGRAMAFECFYDTLPDIACKISRKAMNKQALQPVHRDFAFLFEGNVAAGSITKSVMAAVRGLITEVSIFDLYKGDGAAKGKKSIAFSVTLQPKEKTLTEADIEEVSQKIIKSMEEKGGVLRGS
jgi:phenylalanyl-tRNA synthetase beta chain